MKATIEIVKVRVSDLEKDDVINWADRAVWRRVLAVVEAETVEPRQLQATLCSYDLEEAKKDSWLFQNIGEHKAHNTIPGDWYLVLEHPLEDGSGIDWDLTVHPEFRLIEVQRRIEND